MSCGKMSELESGKSYRNEETGSSQRRVRRHVGADYNVPLGDCSPMNTAEKELTCRKIDDRHRRMKPGEEIMETF